MPGVSLAAMRAVMGDVPDPCSKSVADRGLVGCCETRLYRRGTDLDFGSGPGLRPAGMAAERGRCGRDGGGVGLAG